MMDLVVNKRFEFCISNVMNVVFVRFLGFSGMNIWDIFLFDNGICVVMRIFFLWCVSFIFFVKIVDKGSILRSKTSKWKFCVFFMKFNVYLFFRDVCFVRFIGWLEVDCPLY